MSSRAALLGLALAFAGGALAVACPGQDRPTARSDAPVRKSHGPALAVDGDPTTAFETRKGTRAGTLELIFPEPITADTLALVSAAEGGAGTPRDLRLEAKSGKRFRKVAELKRNFSPRPVLRFRKTTATQWRIVVSAVVEDRWGLRIEEATLLLTEGGPVPTRPEPHPDEREVNKAIDRGVAWLKKTRRADGSWKTKNAKDYPMGVLSLVGLTLKKSGLDRDDPLIQDLVERVHALPMKKVYSVALQAMFLRAVSTKRYTKRLKASAAFLVKNQDSQGLWGYPTGRADLSNAQYAILGLQAARDVGIKVPKKVFQRCADALIRDAGPRGGYTYVPVRKGADADPETGSMTAAALAIFRLCEAPLKRDRGRLGKMAKRVAKARAWLDAHFAVEINPGSGRSHYYWLYGLERVGSFYGWKRIGNRPWYREGAQGLLKWQWRDGSWHRSLEDTCFALLFLNRASLTD